MPLRTRVCCRGLLVLLLLAAATARAATIVADATTCTLAEAIKAANDDRPVGGCSSGNGTDTILLQDSITLTGYHSDSGDMRGGRAAFPKITRPLTIIASGGPRTIHRDRPQCSDSGDDPFRFFNIESAGQVTLQGESSTSQLILDNGCISRGDTSSGGGAIFASSSSLTLRNVVIRNSRIQTNDDYDFADGGAVLIVGSTGSVLEVSDSRFENNILGGAGTARGGAIHALEARVDIRDSTFRGNFARSDEQKLAAGGALFALGDDRFEVYDTVFEDNRAISDLDAFGGAIYGALTATAQILDIARVVFRRNRADHTESAGGTAAGGGVYMDKRFGNLTDVLFQENYATATGTSSATVAGGGMFAQEAVQSISNTTFDRNEANSVAGAAEGGGLHLFGSVAQTLQTMRNVTFARNLARSATNGTAAYGGGMYAHNFTIPVMSHVTMVGNVVESAGSGSTIGTAEGGGLRITSGTVTANNSLFADNQVIAGTSGANNDCHAAPASNFSSAGYNFMEVNGTCGLAAIGDTIGSITGLDTGAAPGNTRCSITLPDGNCLPTVWLTSSSNVRDRGTAGGWATDARGAPRPFNYTAVADAVSGDGSDPGAFERAENAAPVLSSITGLTYIEGQTQRIAPAAVLTDPDHDSNHYTNLDPLTDGWLEVTFTGGYVAAEDVLSVLHEGSGAGLIGFNSGTVSYGGVTIGTLGSAQSGTGIRVSFTSPAATRDAVEKLLRAITYQNLSVSPATAPRTVRFIVNDGNTAKYGGALGTSSAVSATISITQVNTPPVIANLGGGIAYDENDGFVRLDDGNAAVSDPDGHTSFPGGSVTVTIDSDLAEHELSVLPIHPSMAVSGASITWDSAPFATMSTITGPGSKSLTVTLDGSPANVPLSRIDQLLRSIVYRNTSDAPSTALRSAVFVVNDNGGTANGGNPLSLPHTVTIAISAANDPPVFHDLGGTRTFVPGGAAVLLDDNARVTDPELDARGDWTGATLEVARQGSPSTSDEFGFAGVTVVTAVTPHQIHIGGVRKATFTPADGRGQLVISIAGAAAVSAADVQTILRSLTYKYAGAAAPPPSIDLIYRVRDGGNSVAPQGCCGEREAQGQVGISFVNNAPTIENLNGGSVSYTEGTPVLLDGDAFISDPDNATEFNGGSLSVAISAATAQDILLIQPAGLLGVSGSTVSYNAQPIGTIRTLGDGANGNPLAIDFTTANATRAAVEALLRAIAYSSGDNPQTSRVATFVFNDGDGGSAVSPPAVVTITVTPVDDAPVIGALTASLPYQEHDGAVIVDSDVTVTDVDSADFAGGSLTVSIAGATANDLLTIAAPAIGTVSGGTGTPLVVTFNAQATPAAVTALLHTLAYENTSHVPPASRAMTVTVTDGDGGTDSESVTITITPVNDAPAFASLGGTIPYTLGDPATTLDANAVLSDAELDAADNWNGARLEVVRQGGANASDDFDFAPTVSVTIGPDPRMLLTGSIVRATFSETAGKLTIDFNSAARSVDVDAILAAIQYRYTGALAANPTSITLAYTIADGSGGTGSGSVNVTLSFLNHAPVLVQIGGTVPYTEGQAAPVTLDGDAGVTDIDNPPDLENGSLTVTVTGAVAGEDLLSIGTTADITTAGSAVKYQGTTIGTITSSSPLAVTFNINATLASAGKLLQAIRYATGDNPQTSRTVTFIVSDGDGGASGSLPASVTVDVTPVNDIPILTGINGGILSWVENAGPALIDDGNAAASDVDSPDFNTGTLTVSVQSATAADFLGIKNGGTASGQIGVSGANVTYGGVAIGTFAGGSGTQLVVTLNAQANAAAVTQLLRAITWASSSDDPPLARTIDFVLTDGDGGTSVTASATVNISAINDAPAFTDLGGTRTYIRNGTPVALDDNVGVVDPELGNSWGGATIEINRQGGANATDILGFTASNATVNTTVAGKLTITMNAGATTANVESTLRSLTFRNDSAAPGSVVDLLYRVSDANSGAQGCCGAAQGTGQVGVAIDLVNQPPAVNNFDASITTTENVVTTLDANATVSDPDNAANFIGGSLSISMIGAVAGQDTLSIANSGGITYAAGVVRYLGNIIGTVSSPNDGANASQLVIDLTTTSATQTAVSALLQAIAYTSGDAPLPARTVTVVFNDGDGGNASSTPVSMTVNVTAIPDPPVVANFPAALGYNENGGTVVLAVNAAVTDVDSPNFNGGTLTLAIASATAADAFSIQNNATITLSGASVSYIGTPIGTVTASANGTLAIALNTAATPVSITALLRTLTYANTSDAPPATSRTATLTLTDGGGGTGASPLAITITPVNDAPSFAGLGGTASHLLGFGPTTLALFSTLADPELDAADNWNGARLEVVRRGGANAVDDFGFLGGAVSVTTGPDPRMLVIGSVVRATFSETAGKLTIDFNASARASDADAILRAIQYTYTASLGAPIDITLDYTVTDGNGGTGTGSMIVALSFLNHSPVFNSLGGTVTYTEQQPTPVTLDGDATVTDIDNPPDLDTGSLTVTVAGGVAGEDLLSIATTADITTAGNDVKYQGTTFGTIASTSPLVVAFNGNSSLAAATGLVQAIRYASGDNPPASRLISFAIRDGDNGFGSGNVTVQITQVNDAPLLAGINGGSVSWVENAGPALIDDGDAVASDVDSPDFNTGTLTVSVRSATASDFLGIRNDGTAAGQIGVSVLSTVTYGGVPIGTFTGGSAGAPLVVTFSSILVNATHITALLRAITYASSSDTPPLARTIDFVLTDGDGGTSATSSATVNISPVNDAPAFTDLGGTRAYVLNGSPVALDDNVGVVDPELGNSWGGTTIEINRQGGPNATDVLAFTPVNATVNTTVAGKLTITMNAGASAANVEATLRSITFRNDSAAPGSVVDLLYRVSDANSGAQGCCGAAQGTGQVSVSIDFVNHPPSIAGFDATRTAAENAVTTLDANATVSDPDNAASFNGGSLAAAITGAVAGQDFLSIAPNANITFAGGIVKYQGNTIGTVSSPNDGTGGNPLEIDFTTASATPAAVSALLQTLAYTSGDAPQASRTATVVFNDGDGGSASSAPVSMTITVTLANDAPVLANLDGDVVTFTENAAATLLDNGNATASDPDLPASFNGGSLTVAITGATANDVVSIRTAGQIALSGATVSYAGTAIGTLAPPFTVALNANATPAAVTALLRALTYLSTSEVPPASRVATVTLSDGIAPAAAVVTIAITPVNDPPALQSLGGTVTYSGGAAVTLDADVSVADAELDAAGNWAGATIQVARSGAAQASDVFTSSSGSSSGGILSLTIPASTTNAAVATLLRSITYRSTALSEPAATIAIAYTLTDGTGGTATGQVSVNLAVVNHAPSIANLSGDAVSYTEGAAAVLLDLGGNAVVSDADLPANLSGGSLTVSIGNGGAGQDLLSIRDHGAITVTGSTVRHSGTAIGTIAAPQEGGAGNPLVVTLNANATLAAAGALLQAVAYASGNAPEAVRTATFTLEDGAGTANGGNDTSAAATVTINVTRVNDAPSFAGLDATVSYQPGDPAVLLDADATVSDPELDAAGNWNGAVLTVARGGGANAGDDFGFGARPNLLVSGANLQLSGVTVATFTDAAGTLTVTFNASATPSAAAAILQSINYRSTTTIAPTMTLAYTISDGALQGSGSVTITTRTPTTTTVINTVPNPSTFGGAVTVAVNVTTLVGTPAGSVTVTDDSGAACAIVLAAGGGSCALTPLAAGTRTLTASYAGNTTYAPSSGGATITVDKAASTVTIAPIAPNPSAALQTLTVAVTVSAAAGTPAGTVTVGDGAGAGCSIALSAGAGSCALTPLTSGARTIAASYGGSANHLPGSASAAQTVNAAATATTITADTPDPSTFGAPVTVSVTVAPVLVGGTPTGTVAIAAGSASCTATLANGAGSCTLIPPAAGLQTITATYGGDTAFAASSDVETHSVGGTPTTTAVAATPASSTYGTLVTASVSVTSSAGTPGGTVVVTDGAGASCTVTLAAGFGSCTLTPSAAGAVTLTASYGGSSAFAGSSGTAALAINAAATTTVITADAPDPSQLGQSVIVAFTVTAGYGTPAGTVTVDDGAGVTCTATLAAGSGTCSLTPLVAGARNFTATYAGSAFHRTSSDVEAHTVTTGATMTTITADTPDPSAPGQAVTIAVTVTSASGVPDGTVTVSNGAAACLVTLAAGSGTCALTFTQSGAHTLTATYSPPDADFGTSSDTEPHTVTGGNRVRGDVNGNGVVSAFDASLVLQAVVGSIALNAGEACAADYNGNGSVSAFDAALILQCVVEGNCGTTASCN